MKTALVTGANGFLGRHVAKLLASEGHQVIGMGHGTWTRDQWKCWGLSDWHSCDINLQTLRTYGGAPDEIFHCAGSGSVAYSITHPLEDFNRTVETCISVLEFARLTSTVKRTVIPSSAGVYGATTITPTPVNTPLAPASPYGYHKVMAEHAAKSYAQFLGVRVSIVRLFSVYGPELRKQLLWDACTKLTRGDAKFSGTGDETRDWIHVTDAASLMLAASKVCNENFVIFNGGSGNPVSVATVVNELSSALNTNAATTIDFDGAKRPGDPERYHADIAESLALGWRPIMEWRTGVREYAEWFKEDAK
ncbi:NAD-dependent epimerase/dehydratase family protein [Aquabacterium sp.]|uniref:NAD-dependent epimerase/dehydratase family protein n=1 Tax=Aquabacterium sp. TaxID=1872578 RepID=UPI0035AE94B4